MLLLNPKVIFFSPLFISICYQRRKIPPISTSILNHAVILKQVTLQVTASVSLTRPVPLIHLAICMNVMGRGQSSSAMEEVTPANRCLYKGRAEVVTFYRHALFISPNQEVKAKVFIAYTHFPNWLKWLCVALWLVSVYLCLKWK